MTTTKPKTMISAHFSEAELACPHCGRCELKASLVIALEELRQLVGAPITVLSGFRCPEHNKAIGGEQGSKHCEGLAADIALPSSSVTRNLESFYNTALKVEAFKGGGIGVYPAGRGQHTSFLHVDVRGVKARWARIDGKYVGVEEAWKA